MANLSVVPDPRPDHQASLDRERAGYTPFQGKEVTEVTLSLKGTVKLPIDTELRVDDIVRVVAEARVTALNFAVDEKNGTLGRHQAAKVLDVELAPWDPSNPDDRGVLR